MTILTELTKALILAGFVSSVGFVVRAHEIGRQNL